MLASHRQHPNLNLPLYPPADLDDSFQQTFFDDTTSSSYAPLSPTISELSNPSQRKYFPVSPQLRSAQDVSFAPAPIADDYMSSTLDFAGPAIRIQQSTPTPTPQLAFGYPQQSVLVDGGQAASNNWLFGEGNTQMLGGSSLHTSNRRDRTHQRVSSTSSAGSNIASHHSHAPQLMYGSAAQSPSIAKIESSFNADESSRTYANHHLPTPTQTPTTQESFIASTQSAFNNSFQNFDSTVAAHTAMKTAFADGNSVAEDDAPGFSHSTRHSVSSFGRNSPATPRTVNGEDFEEGLRATSNETAMRNNNQVPKFERSMTDVFSDELFNPLPTSQPSSTLLSAPKSANTLSLLSPYRNAMMNERLQQANQARTQSPIMSSSRPLSPFRHSSPFARSSNTFGSPQGRFATAQQAREQQQAEAQANALSRQNMMSQQDNEPKTISPKDALLDYSANEEEAKMPLFPETEASNFSAYSAADTYGALSVSSADNAWVSPIGQNAMSYGVTASSIPAPAPFSFAPASVPGAFHKIPSSNFSSVGSISAQSEDTPDFPAHLTSMESSGSEAPPQSSNNTASETVSKPPSTLADSGTYTCTYHGCTQRFETPQKLQRHKREAHRQNVQQHQQQSSQPDYMPGVGSGMSSAALLARNSQAGPHKCDRINPTTGKPCNTIFSRPYDLTRHEDTIHNCRKQKVRCALCQEDKTFSRNDALTRHMRVVHPDVDFPGKHRRRGGRGDD